jgi:hypothetical protein
MRENCTRDEAELFAKSCVAGRLNLCNMYGDGLAVADCFDAVLSDPGRSVYLRRSPEVVNHEIVLSNTSVVVQSPISSQITQPQGQGGSVPTSIIHRENGKRRLPNTSEVQAPIWSQITQSQVQAGSVPTAKMRRAMALLNNAGIVREADMMPISSTSRLIRRKGPAEVDEIPPEVKGNEKRRKVGLAHDEFATEVMQVIRTLPFYNAMLMSYRTLQRISMSMSKKPYLLSSKKKTAD